MRWYWDQYLPAAEGRLHPDASPLHADLRGVAPATIVVCEFDPLLDEGVEYAERLRDAGVEVNLIHEPGMIHGYIRMPALIARARKSWDDIAADLRRAFVAAAAT
jgi:acetyl esterase